MPEDSHTARDWWTGHPLTSDVDHTDNYFVIDPAGIEDALNALAIPLGKPLPLSES